MNDHLKNRGKDFANFLGSLSKEEREIGNQKEFERAKKEHLRFKENFNKGLCYLCKKPLKTFSKNNPCLHWLLKPKGFKKKNFLSISEKFGLVQIQSFLRWVANEEAFAKNINNLVDEGIGNKLIELTIKYKNLEWSFSCALSDYEGHQNSKFGTFPHYHFQMRVDKRPFIRFNDFHVPLSDMDIITFEAVKRKPDLIKQRFSFGEGMSEMFEDTIVEKVLSNTQRTENPEEATYSIDTFAYAEDGKTISGDDLYEIIQEAKDKGATVASLMDKLPNAESKIIISPGPGVVEQAPRPGRKKKDSSVQF